MLQSFLLKPLDKDPIEHTIFLQFPEDPETLETLGPATFPGLSGEKWLAHTRYDAARQRDSVRK